LTTGASSVHFDPVNVQESLLREQIDPHLTDDSLSTIASAALGSAVRVHGHQVLTGGCWNRVIAVDAGDRPLVFKISPHAADDRIKREFLVLDRFRELTELPVPQPLLVDADSRFTPGTLLVMTRIPGAVMHECFGMLGEDHRRRITGEIAEHLASLHTIRSRGFGGVELPEDKRHAAWAEFWLPRFDSVLEDATASGVVPAPLIDGARAVRPNLAPLLEIGAESTMTHYDIWSGNVMIDLDGEAPTVSGYIDIPGFFADYARELSFAMLFGVADHDFFEVYARRHRIDDGVELRANIYNLKMNLRHITMYPSEAFYQRGAASCLATIERHLGGR
jgi:fructosamine-3-kinase